MFKFAALNDLLFLSQNHVDHVQHDAVDNMAQEGLQHRSSPKAKCTDKSCPLSLEESALVSNEKIIHAASTLAENGHGDKKVKALAFVKSLQSRINKVNISCAYVSLKSVSKASEHGHGDERSVHDRVSDLFIVR